MVRRCLWRSHGGSHHAGDAASKLCGTVGFLIKSQCMWVGASALVSLAPRSRAAAWPSCAHRTAVWLRLLSSHRPL